MKKFKKLLVVALAAVSCCLPAGCDNGTTGGGSKQTLSIRVSNAGYGYEWLEKLKETFEKTYKVNVKIEQTVVMPSDLTKLEADYQMEDIFFSMDTQLVRETIKAKKFECIDDVWDSVPSGESKTIKEKVVPMYAETGYKYDGHYYSLPVSCDVGGIAYNKTTLNECLGENNWSVPKTSNEMVELAKRVKEKGAWGFVWTGSQFYWEVATSSWATQYNGYDVQNKLNAGYYLDGDEWKFSKNGECLDQDVGTLREYEALDEIIDKANGLSSEYCNVMDFMEAQGSFAGLGYGQLDKKKVAFSPNGAWLYHENREDFEYAGTEPGFFNVVMSACVEKLSFYNETEGFYQLPKEKQNKYDKALSAIVTWIDGGKTGAKPTSVEGYTVTEDDLTRVDEMRRTESTLLQAHAGIAANSKNKELAKKFLTFFASDYAGQIYIKYADGFTPFYYKDVDLDDNTPEFVKDVYSMLNKDLLLAHGGFHSVMAYVEPYHAESGLFDKTIGSNEYINSPQKGFNVQVLQRNKAMWRSIVTKAGKVDLLNG